MAWSIRTKLHVGFGIVLLMMVAIGFVNWQYMKTLMTESTHLYDNNVQATVQLGKIQNALWQLRYSLLQFPAESATERDKIMANEALWYQEIKAAFRVYTAGVLTAAERAAVQEWEGAFGRYVEARSQWFALHKEGKEKEVAAWQAQTTTPYSTASVAALGRLMELQQQAGGAAQSAMTVAAEHSVRVQILLLVVAVLIGGGVVTLLTSNLGRQVRRIMATFRQINQADYTARVEVVSKDELGAMATSLNAVLDHTLALMIQSQQERDGIQASIMKLLEEVTNVAEGDLTLEAEVTEDATGAIADSFNYMIQQLRSVVARVQETTLLVSASANEVQATAEQVAQGSTIQATQIIDSSAALDEMAMSIQQVSENAVLSATVAEQALANARQGTAAVQNTIQGMSRIRAQVQETAKRIKRLGERSQEIGEIVQLIDDIADRTSILALNASIQAARAGDAGRAFVVVAEEVERLAERASNATKQIAGLVNTIQSETNEAVTAMEGSTREVVQGSQLADQAGQALGEIEGVSERLAELIQSISLASKQQARGSESLSKAMNEIADVTQQTAAGTKQATISINNLTMLADELRSSVSTFKLPVTTNGHSHRM